MNKTPHPYAEVLRWIADGEDIEFKDSNGWIACSHAGAMGYIGSTGYSEGKFRIKPKTIRIGEFDVPEPMRTAPEKGVDYFMPNISGDRHRLASALEWGGYDVANLKRGICHATREAAEIHAKALISLTEKP